MPNSVPTTAVPGSSQSGSDRLAKGLGYLSIALGAAELLAPRAVCAAAGMDGREGLVRLYGAREIATGLAILSSHDATPWIWGRVAGDVLDMATVAAGLQPGNPRKGNAAGALIGLAAVTALDLICANRLGSEKGNRKTAVADYRHRTGYPNGLQIARSAARDFEVPRDMRIPEPLRPYASARH